MFLSPDPNPNSVPARHARMVSAARMRELYSGKPPAPMPQTISVKATVSSISSFQDGGYFVRLNTRHHGDMLVFLNPRDPESVNRIVSAHADESCHEMIIEDDGPHKYMRGRILSVCA